MSDAIDFKAVFEFLPAAYLLVGPDLVALEANHAMRRVLGRPREDIVGLPVKALFDALLAGGASWPAHLVDASYRQALDGAHADTVLLPKIGPASSGTGGHWELAHTPVPDLQGNSRLIVTRLADAGQPHAGDAMRDPAAAIADPAAGSHGSPAPAAPAAQSVPADALHILFVEDNEDLRESTAQLLEGLGHSVVAVPDAEKALVRLETEQFHVLLSDLSLPKMTGAELAREVAQHYPRMRIVITSGFGRAMANARGLNAVMLPKPYRIAELAAALKGESQGSPN